MSGTEFRTWTADVLKTIEASDRTRGHSDGLFDMVVELGKHARRFGFKHGDVTELKKSISKFIEFARDRTYSTHGYEEWLRLDDKFYNGF